MKYILVVFCFVFAIRCWAVEVDSAHTDECNTHAAHRPTMLSLGIGFGDYYRTNPTFGMPTGFRTGNITGFALLSARIEYGLTNHFSIGANIYYDRFQYNYYQDFSANSRSFSRNMTNSFSLFGAGLSALYFPQLHVKIPNLEPFIQIGLSLNNIQQSAVPQGDSTVPTTTHRASPVVKIGGRYFFSKARNAGIYLELGYDRQSIVNIGFTSKLTRKKGKHIRL